MADTTPVYGLPYQELGDAPDGPALGEDLAVAVETELVRIDADVAAINGLSHAFNGSSNAETNFQNTTFAAGSTTVGAAFVAPPSGSVLAHFTFAMTQSIDGQVSQGSIELRTGAVVGSGSVSVAASGNRALTVGRAVNTGAVAQIQATRTCLFTGLTAGSSYNVRLMHVVSSGGTGNISYREVIVQPLL